ncbi:acetyl-CoA C-acetyltransferase [Pseudomonas duriflava]|uniref:Acetyl-CoA C-acetyltransferase n=1 Tax=Pseudomonas duriflava TaxID=459528 RepID=A0A562QE64_9PSED|nr:thiolase family protein [Pseudomonas duriflava]TWI55042.1 acetyl-CoA C-acetyltransferase [Pseudomonas duriflava]
MTGRKGLYSAFNDVVLLGGVRTPWVDYCGALGQVSPIDLGIKVAREALTRCALPGEQIDSVLAGSVAQSSFDAYLLPRHIGLYAGVPVEVPALQVQRICGTGFELLRQAGEQIMRGEVERVLCVASESMSRNPIAAYTHRTGFRLGAPVEFKDFLWEALVDPAPGVDMIGTAENLASHYGIQRADVDAYALRSFDRALAAQEAGWFAEEIVAVEAERFSLNGYQARGIALPRKTEAVDTDTHPRSSSLDALARLRPIHEGGVQTAGNSCAVVDGAAAIIVSKGQGHQGPVLGRLIAATAVGVPPELMGIGPAPAIRLLLERSGLRLDDIACFEINEAQGAQVLAVQRELELDLDRLNIHGGSIALGHPLAATGLRLSLTLARQLRALKARYGVAAACVGGGQGMAVLIENPDGIH